MRWRALYAGALSRALSVLFSVLSRPSADLCSPSSPPSLPSSLPPACSTCTHARIRLTYQQYHARTHTTTTPSPWRPRGDGRTVPARHPSSRDLPPPLVSAPSPASRARAHPSLPTHARSPPHAPSSSPSFARLVPS
ncbi:hypothetical protein DENSPDRAFT_846184 [Dentipellis sp. KUC8613]|nr:hypothetical protein DENSPDRAFT_844706 [Dentipellis sp. KUC8613]KAA1479314.1 hypothetical protein DENSPDRAFT_846184 [Dentipellis sp. KUC8613]